MGGTLSLFDGRWLPPFEDHYTRPIFVDSHFGHPGETGRFLRNWLLYDRLYLPTVSLLVAPLLVSIIGQARLVDALETGEITLLRYRGALGYGADGEGVRLYQTRTHFDGTPNPEAARPWASTEAVLADLGEQFAARGRRGRENWAMLTRAVLDNVVEIEPDAIAGVAQATYDELRRNGELRRRFGIPGERPSSLPGVQPGQVRWLTGGWLADGIDALLHLTQTNLEADLAGRVGAHDRSTGMGAVALLAARGAPTRLLELRHVSEFAAAHGNARLLDAIWRVRASGEGQAFRRWFHTTIRERPAEAEAQLIETLVRPTVGDRGGRRPLDFLLPDANVPGAKLLVEDDGRGLLPDPIEARARGYRANRARAPLRRGI